MGWFVCIKKNELIIIKIIIIWLISENSLIKILILEIKDSCKIFSDVLKKKIYFWFTRPMFYLNY